MSLKRRNWIAIILLLGAAVCWTLGQWLLNGSGNEAVLDTSSTMVTRPTAVTEEATFFEDSASLYPTTTGMQPVAQNRYARWPGFLLCIGSIILAAVATFGLWQRKAFLGPDGAALVLAFVLLFRRTLLGGFYDIDTVIYGILTFSVLAVLRELWGWVRCKCSLSWCAVSRIGVQSESPQIVVLVDTLWLVGCFVLLWLLSRRYDVLYFGWTYFFIAVSGSLGGLCLWRYGADLHHLQQQLENYRKGMEVTPREGAFVQTEELLLHVQAQHEEAVQKAVTSERFKVELISNVSHDLRTPLTAILGYSELLQQEKLSPDGQEQLRHLHLKAGYMNDLVESLFELTKVSSGSVQSKKERIDLIRLLEQTLGLFDDQLEAAGLSVRRHYEQETACVITDGARMHQVFANLLGNAIKYALPGTRIHLEVREREQYYRIRMVNTASYEMDFEPEEIMQRFARGDKARSTKGSGLGLAIAQTYTESVGGTFRVGVDGDQFSAIVELPKSERII